MQFGAHRHPTAVGPEDVATAQVQATPVPVPVVTTDPNAAKYQALGEYLARRYRVSLDMTTAIVANAYDIGHQMKLDPTLILAVIAIESRFNPIAESTMGAKGLMQVIPKFHPEKFKPLGGEKVAFETGANIRVGAGILKEYLRRAGDLDDALQMYVGASTDENETRYSTKVIEERDRLNHLLQQFQGATKPAGRQTPVGRTGPAI
jgi:hypothetical protein